MAGKRKGIGAGRGAQAKRTKIPKKKSDEKFDLLAFKISAKTAVREQFHDTILPWIAEKSIECTKICELASLLFLNKMKVEFEAENWDYFDGDGAHVIESCFYAVLQRYKENEDMIPQFRNTFQNLGQGNEMPWPNNHHFGNLTKYLYQQYATNVITNLTTHAQKRLRNYLKVMAFYDNRNNPNQFIDKRDIDNTIKLTMKGFDSTKGQRARIYKRQQLLEHIHNVGGPVDDNISRFTKEQWFRSLSMWLYMQEKIDEYLREYQIVSNEAREQMPKVKNLSVIPICSHMRKTIRIDADILYHMMCDLKIIPRINGNGPQVSCAYVCQNQEHFFNQIFNMDHINRLLKANKSFGHIVSDGVSASIVYKVPQRVVNNLANDNLVKQQYMDGTYVYVLGIDPGMKTWMAAVRRHINTGKEV